MTKSYRNPWVLQLPEKLEFLLYPARYKVAYGGRGSSKCFAPGTPVMMFDGTIKPVEQVEVGDQVMGPDSKPRNVLDTVSGKSKLFQVKQTSAMSYVVNKDHILSLKKSKSCANDCGETMPSGNKRRSRGRYPNWPEITNISVAEYLEQSNRWKEHFRGYRAGLLRFDAQDVPVDPYLLGVWLGDGLHRELMVTSADHEIIGWLNRFSADNGLVFTEGRKPGNKASDYRLGRNPKKHGRVNPVWQGFKALGVVSNKHIPHRYIQNSEEVRLKLLAGLIDSDGTMVRNGFAITQKNKRLAEGIKHLADTLGFRTSIKRHVTKCHNNGKIGEAWRVSINGDTWKMPCLVERKQVHRENYKPNKDKTLSCLSVKSVGWGSYHGFSVDGDHLFCLADGTVTHNSWSFARALLKRGIEQTTRILCAREVQNSIKDSVHKLLSDQIKREGLEKDYEVLDQVIRHRRNGSEFLFTGLLQHTTDSLKSFEGVDICWVEEAHSVSKRSWDILIPTIRKDGSEIWISFNPDLETDETYQRFVTNPPPGAGVVPVNYMDNPWFNEIMEQERLHCKETDPDNYPNIWEGKCRPAVEGAIYFKEIQAAEQEGRICNVPYDPLLKVHVVIDLGWNDYMGIGLVQRGVSDVRFIRYLQDNRRTLDSYSSELKQNKYNWGRVWLPHDGFSGDVKTGLTTQKILQALSWDVPGREEIVEASVEEGIRQTRMAFNRFYFDKEHCSDLVECAKRYRRSVNRTTQAEGKPVHDEYSHGADVLRYTAVNLNNLTNEDKRSTFTPIQIGQMRYTPRDTVVGV